MNKRKVDALIPRAYDILAKVEIAKDGKIDKAWRGQIASFGAAISMGSLLSAVCFFSDNGNAAVERKKLMNGIFLLIKDEYSKQISNANTLFELISQKSNGKKLKEDILNAAIALKLAMNLYTLE
ncbi:MULTISPECIES: type III-B CRISPR module-associated protein Cmr5 [Caproicibacterium]|uniref:Type III-B CRISPR module-associated protein Cmr5 n=1 Tax=Caproicibacterium argilliputei TaxID=3030016 RepID=A0AA97DA16_9FIRM|nr:type III-B CRISPR module-associated protein Cmr5 [Caproicibacterium argilliputei]WOC31810.1 type III-B CRISPR module-associated protein Cmr5 [Caproicibacterium argilliputei]